MKPEEEEFQLGKVRTLLRDKRKPATIIICSVPVYSVVLCSIPFHSVAQGNISSLFFFFFFLPSWSLRQMKQEIVIISLQAS